MVVANSSATHKALPNKATMIYDTLMGGNRPEDRVHGWEKTQEIRSGRTTRCNHCFELPGQNLEAVETIQGNVSVGSVSHTLTAGGGGKLERYDYPGLYAQRFDGINPGGGDRAADIQKIFQDNARTTKIRMEQEAAQAMTIRAQSDCREACPGFKFKLTEHLDADGEYILTRVEHFGSMERVYTSDVDHEVGYANAFTAIPSGLPYRPRLKTKRAPVAGTQTAIVVGPKGEEIFTDKYSRVKVQFHWDRDGKHDDNSSCWVRVSTLWAGKQWGMIHIPRIGQEVIVDFEEGDPDRPLILGSVYSAEQMPPYKLPDNRTQSGMKSRSALKGSEEKFNELRFEVKKGEEQVYFHAEKNFDRVVENNDTLKVGFEKKNDGNQTIEIFNNQANTIGAGKGHAKDGSQTTTSRKPLRRRQP